MKSTPAFIGLLLITVLTSCDPAVSVMIENRTKFDKHIKVHYPEKFVFPGEHKYAFGIRDSIETYDISLKDSTLILVPMPKMNWDTISRTYSFLLKKNYGAYIENRFMVGQPTWGQIFIIDDKDTIRLQARNKDFRRKGVLWTHTIVDNGQRVTEERTISLVDDKGQIQTPVPQIIIPTDSKEEIPTPTPQEISHAGDKEQIQTLIRQVLNWADTRNSIYLLPLLTDNNDSIYIGFDLDKHKQNLDKLGQANFFATEFIENYNQIILTLDEGLRNGKYNQWLVGDLPTFMFANNINPWTLTQDIPYDKPSPWDFVEINIIDLDNGEVDWKWGNLDLNSHEDWKELKYRFRVVKENNLWKIAYLQGFDFKESIRKDGYLSRLKENNDSKFHRFITAFITLPH